MGPSLWKLLQISLVPNIKLKKHKLSLKCCFSFLVTTTGQTSGHQLKDLVLDKQIM